MSQKRSSGQSATPESFEEAIRELEQIVRRLEGDETSLNDSLANSERGVKLWRHCYQLLEGVERKIELLSGVDAEGNPISVPLDDTALTLDEKANRRSRRRSSNPPPSVDKREEEGGADMDVPGGLF